MFAACPARAGDETGLAALVELLLSVDDPGVQLDVLRGMHEGLRGRKGVKAPPRWPEVYSRLTASRSKSVPSTARALGVIFGDAAAIADLRRMMLDPAADPAERQAALSVLVENRAPELGKDLIRLLDSEGLAGPAIRALAAYPQPGVPKVLLSRYAKLAESERADVVTTLIARRDWALALLEAVEKGLVPRHDITAYHARHLREFRDKQLDARLEQVWGSIRETSRQKAVLLAKYKAQLSPEALLAAEPARGQLVFKKNCAACHLLFGQGGNVGPDLTGSNRRNLDYILENVLDPSALVARDYRVSIVATTDGRVISGIVRPLTGGTLQIQTANETVLLAKDDIAAIEESPLSMMPEGAFERLSPQEIADLVAYLRQ